MLHLSVGIPTLELHLISFHIQLEKLTNTFPLDISEKALTLLISASHTHKSETYPNNEFVATHSANIDLLSATREKTGALSAAENQLVPLHGLSPGSFLIRSLMEEPLQPVHSNQLGSEGILPHSHYLSLTELCCTPHRSSLVC